MRFIKKTKMWVFFILVFTIASSCTNQLEEIAQRNIIRAARQMTYSAMSGVTVASSSMKIEDVESGSRKVGRQRYYGPHTCNVVFEASKGGKNRTYRISMKWYRNDASDARVEEVWRKKGFGWTREYP